MKTNIITCSFICLFSVTLQAQGLLNKLKNAMMAPPISGFYEAALTTKGTFAQLPKPQGLQEFSLGQGERDFESKFYYQSSVLDNAWYEKANFPNLRTKVYFPGDVTIRKTCIRVEDSILYFVFQKDGFKYDDYNFSPTDIYTVLTSSKDFLKEISAWNPKETPSSDRIKNHLTAIKQAFEDIKVGRKNMVAAAAKASDDKLYNRPLPTPGGGHGSKMFAEARKTAIAKFKDEMENLGVTWLEPIYAYEEQQTPYWSTLKNNLGNEIGRGVNLFVVCKNNKPGEYVYSKHLWKTKYVVARVFIKQDGSGGSFSGPYYYAPIGLNGIAHVGDQTDAMMYKK